ncbi:MAG: hypothetical protein AB7H92_14085 [Microbacteriaceae bacterium]
MTTPSYPVPRVEQDRRLSPLIADVARVLVDYGYPPVEAVDDVLRLQQALVTFIYGGAR